MIPDVCLISKGVPGRQACLITLCWSGAPFLSDVHAKRRRLPVGCFLPGDPGVYLHSLAKVSAALAVTEVRRATITLPAVTPWPRFAMPRPLPQNLKKGIFFALVVDTDKKRIKQNCCCYQRHAAGPIRWASCDSDRDSQCENYLSRLR